MHILTISCTVLEAWQHVPKQATAALRPICCAEKAEDDDLEALLDVIMLRLRTSDGIDLSQVRQHFGRQLADAVHTALQKHEAAGLVRSRSHAGDSVGAETYQLTDPEGFLLSNDIMSDCFAAVQRVSSKPLYSSA